jgi:hypothetical protein
MSPPSSWHSLTHILDVSRWNVDLETILAKVFRDVPRFHQANDSMVSLIKPFHFYVITNS